MKKIFLKNKFIFILYLNLFVCEECDCEECDCEECGCEECRMKSLLYGMLL